MASPTPTDETQNAQTNLQQDEMVCINGLPQTEDSRNVAVDGGREGDHCNNEDRCEGIEELGSGGKDTKNDTTKLIEDDTNGSGGDYDSFGDGEHVFKKYRFRKRGSQPDYTAEASLPHSFKRRTRYEPQDSYDCDQCAHSFDSRTGLLNHIRKHISNKQTTYTCMLCSEIFKTNTQLIQHKAIHRDEVYRCDKCEIAFTDHCDYLEHEISHTLRSQYKCEECGKYYNKIAMTKHFQSHYDRPVKCDICQAMVQKGSLDRHLLNHSSVKCVECGESFKPSTLKYHMSKHTGVKPWQCLYCGKGFPTNNQRQVHSRVHSNERPFTCDICQQKFKQTTDLKRHKRTHFEQKHQCNVCNKKFIHIESYMTHMSIHTDTQKYKCEICDKAISTVTGYKFHMLYKHSSDKVYSCGACEMSFKTKMGLTRHERSKAHRRRLCQSEGGIGELLA